MQGVIPLFVPFAAEHYLNLSFQAATENWQEFYCSPLRLGGKTDVQHAFFQCENLIFFCLFLIGREVCLKYLVFLMMKMMRQHQRKELVWIPKGN